MGKSRALVNKLKRRNKYLNRNRGANRQDKIDLKDERLAQSPRAFRLMREVQRRMERAFGAAFIPSPNVPGLEMAFLVDVEALGPSGGSPAVAASYTGTAAGMTTPVTIDADEAGVAGNVTLIGDGTSDIDTLIQDWNTANPGNTLTLSSGDGSQIPDNAAELELTDGADEVPASDGSVQMTFASAAQMAAVGVKVEDVVEFQEGELKGVSLKVISLDSATEMSVEYSDKLTAPASDVKAKVKLNSTKKSYS